MPANLAWQPAALGGAAAGGFCVASGPAEATPAALMPPPALSPALLPLHRRPKALLRLLGTILLVSAVITPLLNPSALGRPKVLLVNFMYTFTFTAALWLVNGYSVDWLNTRADWTRQPGRRLLLTVSVSLLASMGVILLVNAAFLALYWRRSPLQVFDPQMWPQYLVPLIITGVVSLVLHSRSFLQHWREAAIRAERTEKEAAVARFDSLRRQVDPHFLFNSLNALTSLVEEPDPARAVRFIRQLSQVYRYVLDSQEQEVVPLSEELEFVEAYLYLQRTRLGDGLAVEIQAEPAALHALLVPPLAVQLLLENALKHNATSQRDPLRIAIELDAAARRLTVRNTRRPRRLAPGESTGLGLKNLAARYAFLTDQPVLVEQTNTEFVVSVPLVELK